MDLNKLMEIASDVYPDGLVGRHWNDGQGMPDAAELGDDLARFIVIELKDTFDPNASSGTQLEEAARCMNSAANELFVVAEALNSATVDKFEDSDTELEK
jgi:hypothetical protein